MIFTPNRNIKFYILPGFPFQQNDDLNYMIKQEPLYEEHLELNSQEQNYSLNHIKKALDSLNKAQNSPMMMEVLNPIKQQLILILSQIDPLGDLTTPLKEENSDFEEIYARELSNDDEMKSESGSHVELRELNCDSRNDSEVDEDENYKPKLKKKSYQKKKNKIKIDDAGVFKCTHCEKVYDRKEPLRMHIYHKHVSLIKQFYYYFISFTILERIVLL